MIRAPMLTSLSTKKRRFSNSFSKISTVPLGLSRYGEGDGGEVGGERGPGPVLDLRDLGAEVVSDDDS